MEAPPNPTPCRCRFVQLLKTHNKKILAGSALCTVLSAILICFLTGSSAVTCEVIASPVATKQFMSSLTLAPKAVLNEQCLDGILQHKNELQHLKIENYHNVEEIIYALYQFPNLMSLELKNVNLKKFDLYYVAQNTQLKTIVLDNNPGLSFYGNADGIKVTKVSLAGCELSSVPSVLFEMEELYELNMRGNRVVHSDIDFNMFKMLSYYNDQYVQK